MLYRITFTLFFTGFIASCGGGGGGGSITLTTDEQGDDPVVVEVPVAYIRRPLPDQAPDLRDPLAFYPGATLYVRDRSATSGEDVDVSALIAAVVAAEEDVAAENVALDIKDLDSSFDGNTLVFAVRAVPEPVEQNLQRTTWNLWFYDIQRREAGYLINSRIKRNEGVESGGGHDIAPHFLPDDRIVFSSTRQIASQGRLLNEGRNQLFAALDESGRRPAAVLHIYDPLLRGEEFTQISFNPSHDLDPVVLDTGEIVFSRWNNTATNHISLYRIMPSGLGLSPLFGFHSPGVVYSQPRETDDGRLVTVAREVEAQSLGGNIVFVDSAGFSDPGQPLWGNSVAQGSGVEAMSPREVRSDELLSRGGRYGAVYALRDGTSRLLVTWSDCRVVTQGADADGTPRYLPCTLEPDNEEAAPPLYGGWIVDPREDTQRPVVLPLEGQYVSELIAAEPRDFAALLPLPADFNSELAARASGQLLIDSVYNLDGVDASPAGIAAHATPATPPFESRPARFLRFYQSVPLPDPEVFEVPGFAAGVAGGSGFREILGYVPVEPDGSVSAVVPALRAFSFDIVDARGRRSGARHDYWLQVGAGEVLRCTGCHDHASGLPHGHRDAPAPSVNPGARALDNGSLGFAGTDLARLFATQPGQTMAQVWDFHRPLSAPAATARAMTLAPEYVDQWHDPALPAQAAISDRDYRGAWADISPERAIVVDSFDPGQPARIVINYVDHIQPVWERARAARPDGDGNPVDTCVGCHSDGGGARVPAGQLDLSAAPASDQPEHYRSYRELLLPSPALWLGADDVPAPRLRTCTRTDDQGASFETVEPVLLSAPARGGSAAGSERFFACFEGGSCGPPAAPPLPDNCTEDGGTVVPATRDSVDHRGLLSPQELHLLSEWLDIGAQYFNNPFDARLAQ
ncbi:MAG: hypothetical protein CME59_21225 [Halioglobus sp.]|nr:hypothetical protein [Halioglobus sp.]